MGVWPGCACVVGLDLMDIAPKLMGMSGDVARRFMAARRMAAPMQYSFTSIEKVRGHQHGWSSLVPKSGASKPSNTQTLY